MRVTPSGVLIMLFTTIIVVLQSFLYIAWYFTFSLLGNFNYFFYAAHLLDVAVCFKTLGTILQSVTHNGKQVFPRLPLRTTTSLCHNLKE